MSISNEEISNAIAPVTILLQFFGLQPYIEIKTDKINHLFCNIGIIVFHITIYFANLYSTLSIEDQSSHNYTSIVDVIYIVYLRGVSVGMLLIYVHIFLGVNKQVYFLNTFFKIIKSLEKFNMTCEVRKQIRSTFKYSLFLVLVIPIGIFCIGDMLFGAIQFVSMYGWLNILQLSWVYIMPNILLAIVEVFLALWLNLVGKLFEVNNAVLLTTLENREPNNDFFKNFIENVLKVHNMLLTCVKQLNELFSSLILIHLVYNYYVLLCSVYFVTHSALFYTYHGEHYKELIFFTKKSILSIFNLCFVTCHVIYLIRQVSKNLDNS